MFFKFVTQKDSTKKSSLFIQWQLASFIQKQDGIQ